MKTTYSRERTTIPRKKVNFETEEETKPWNCHYVIPLVRVHDEVDSDTRKYLSVKRLLPVVAGDNSQGTYEKYILRFEHGSPARWLEFLRGWNEVRNQLNLTTGPMLYANFKTLLEGDALDKWTEVTASHGSETVDHFNECLKDMSTYVFPEDALSTQQTYLSTTARKTEKHTWRQYDVRLHEENKNLKFYPPNFDESQQLQDAVLKANVYQNAPQFFKDQVKVQGFELQEKSTKDLIKFFETRCESVYRAKIAQKRRSASNNNKSGNKRKTRDNAQSKWCSHCKMSNHNTNECHVLKRLNAERQRKEHNKSKKYATFYKNKSMTNEEIKEFHDFNQQYERWAAHKAYKAKKQRHDHHNVEEDEVPNDEDSIGDLSLNNLEIGDEAEVGDATEVDDLGSISE